MTGFERRVMVVGPGEARRYDAAEWRDAIVTVGRGAIDAEPAAGAPVRFVAGDVVALDGLALRAIANAGPQPAVLVAVRRSSAPGSWARTAGSSPRRGR